jgi:hypothetical protein
VQPLKQEDNKTKQAVYERKTKAKPAVSKPKKAVKKKN